jgi:hypothetical protein
MTKVYIVEQGDYSEHSYLGVFSTREKAEEFIRREHPLLKGHGDGDPWISVSGVDGHIPEEEDLTLALGAEVFKVSANRPPLHARKGGDLWATYCSAGGPYVQRFYGDPPHALDKVVLPYGEDIGVAEVYSRDEQKAVKIVSDWVARRNAELEGVA